MVDLILITALVGVIATFLLNVFQSIKSNHFELHSDCVNKTMDLELDTKTKNEQ
jgi:hypothetical protein